MDVIQQNYVEQILSDCFGLDLSRKVIFKKLSGGAIQENWSIEGSDDKNKWDFVLRKNAETIVAASSDREQEYLLLSRLYDLGIKVPKPLFFTKKENPINSEFFIMEKVRGIAEGFKLVRLDSNFKREKILNQIGYHLACIHSIHSDTAIENILIKPEPQYYLSTLISNLIKQLDQLNRYRPILEFAIQWMRNNQPSVDELVLIHGDFRTGNIMVDESQVTGILDWEFTHWGDRREDIGWFTAKCWRFGQFDNIAGGIGSYKDFMQAYASKSDIFIPEFEMKFWHVLSHVRWGIIAMQQSDRNVNSDKPSLELALTEYLLPQLEKNILDILGDKE